MSPPKLQRHSDLGVVNLDHFQTPYHFNREVSKMVASANYIQRTDYMEFPAKARGLRIQAGLKKANVFIKYYYYS